MLGDALLAGLIYWRRLFLGVGHLIGMMPQERMTRSVHAGCSRDEAEPEQLRERRPTRFRGLGSGAPDP